MGRTVLGLEYLHYEGIVHRDIKPANRLKFTRIRRILRDADGSTADERLAFELRHTFEGHEIEGEVSVENAAYTRPVSGSSWG
jgi:hypothetical protein